MGDAEARPVSVPVPPSLLDVLRDGPAPLTGTGPRIAQEAEPLSIAFVGPGDGALAAALGEALVARGHVVSHWPQPGEGMHTWPGADVALATGPRAAWRVLALPHVGARALLMGADEEARHGASPARTWAAEAARSGLPLLCAGDWLAQTLSERHGVSAASFTRGIDEAYRPLPTHRRDDLVLLDAPAEEPWRGAALALLTGRELLDRRPGLTIGVARGELALREPYPLLDGGPPDPDERAELYALATVGVVCAADGPDPVIGEMLACGLPVVALEAAVAGPFGEAVDVAAADPIALADMVQALLDDLVVRAERSLHGTETAAAHTWRRAAAEAEAALLDLLAGA